MKCWRCGNETTTIETTVPVGSISAGDSPRALSGWWMTRNLCTDCHYDYLSGGRLHMPTPDPIDQFTAPYPHNRMCPTEANEPTKHCTPPRLTDEEVWLRAWEDSHWDGEVRVKEADACLAAFRQRFREGRR